MSKCEQELFGKQVIGKLSGLDRVRFRGFPRILQRTGGIISCLRGFGKKLEDFKRWTTGQTGVLRECAQERVQKAGRPWQRIDDSKIAKDELARKIAERDGITEGLICGFSALEPCYTFELASPKGKLFLRRKWGKCLHVYHYLCHSVFGFMHVRLQTWLPYQVTICINGHEWLGREMDRAGIRYERYQNCFTYIEDFDAAQKLFDKLQRTAWNKQLNAVLRQSNPALRSEFRSYPLEYYWTAPSTEWATDITFGENLHDEFIVGLARFGLVIAQSPEVFRFLGNKLTSKGRIHGCERRKVISKLLIRPEGITVKHRLGTNSLKLYAKAANVLRIETTINDPSPFKVYRKCQRKPRAKSRWQPLRKGVADLHRRSVVSHKANQRYLKALSAVETGKSLSTLIDPLAQPAKLGNSCFRPLNPISGKDARLLQAVACGEFAINGFRNRDIRQALYGPLAPTPEEFKRQSRAVTHSLRLLRAHKLIAKVPRTHRYQLTDYARSVIAALLAARDANSQQLLKMVA